MRKTIVIKKVSLVNLCMMYEMTIVYPGNILKVVHYKAAQDCILEILQRPMSSAPDKMSGTML